jgi:small subunit ribosomal protein S7
MSRKSSSKQKNQSRFTQEQDCETFYQSRLVFLFRKRLLQDGKSSLARKILFRAFQSIEETSQQPGVEVLREAVLNVTPIVEVKPQRRGGTVFQVPVEVSPERGTLLALSWLAQAARQRSGRGMVSKLAAELIDASKKTGSAVRKKEELHRMAEANKALSHFRF